MRGVLQYLKLGKKWKKRDDLFNKMLDCLLTHGGNQLLLYKLLNRKITNDINTAPNTQALVEQKLESLDVVGKWLYYSLQNGEFINIINSDFKNEDNESVWPEQLETSSVFMAIKQYCKEETGIKYLPSEDKIGRYLINQVKIFKKNRIRLSKKLKYIYKNSRFKNL